MQQFLILAIIIFTLLFGELIPTPIAQMIYTSSLFIKDVLMWLLPIIVMIFISSSLAQFGKKALPFLMVLIVFEGVSNSLAVNYAYTIVCTFEDFLRQSFSLIDSTQNNNLTPLFTISHLRPSFWVASKGTYFGVGIGLIISFVNIDPLHNALKNSKKYLELFLKKILKKCIPLFICGFLLNLSKSGQLSHLLGSCGIGILIIFASVFFYILVLYIISSGAGVKLLISQFRNALAPATIAVSTGCSMTAMPFTIEAAKQNTRNPDFAPLVIPGTTNIQQIGDCIANIMFGHMLLIGFGLPLPGIENWIEFMILYILARYTTAAVLGGAFFITLPLWQNSHGFTTEMVAILLAFNVVMDPLITMSNVLANISLCTTFEKLWVKITKKEGTHRNHDIYSSPQ